MDVQNVIEQLKQIVTPEKILTDYEDLYVYSFEKIFEKRNPTPDIVVKTLSKEEVKRILESAREIGFTVIQRGETVNNQKIKKPLVLIDNIPLPELKTISPRKSKINGISKEIREKGYDTPRNLVFALKTSFLGKNFAECLECKTCSGYCTVAQSFEGIETWSSKGRTILIRGLQNEELPISKKVIDILYTCTGCGLCFAQCFEELKVHKAILATRHRIVQKNLTPKVFRETARNVLETRDPGAVSIKRRLSWMNDLSVHSLPMQAEILYWVGCTVAYRTPKTAKAFFEILTYANVKFTMLKEREGCCGYVLLSTGLWKEAKKVAKETLLKIEKTRAETLVTPCAGCYYTFTKLYPEIFEISFPCEIFHSSQFIENLMKDGELKFKRLNFKVSYHDPCSLGRHSRVFNAPRNVIKAIPNLTLVEMPLNRQLARCCGGGGGLWSFNPDVSINSAYLRLRDVEPLEVDVLTTACPLCQINLRYASLRKSVPIKVCDINEIVRSALHTL